MRWCLLIAMLLAGSAVSASALSGWTVRLNQSANGTTKRVHVGDTLILTLSANASTGYAWTFKSTGTPILRLLSARYVPPPQTPTPRLGAPGTFVARLAVRRTGRTTVALAYLRHTHPATPAARRFKVTIVAIPR